MPSSSGTNLEVHEVLELTARAPVRNICLHGYMVDRHQEVVIFDVNVEEISIENWLNQPYVRVNVPDLMSSLVSVMPLQGGGISNIFAEGKVNGDLIYNEGDSIWDIVPTSIILKSYRRGNYDTEIDITEAYIQSLKRYPEEIHGGNEEYEAGHSVRDWLGIAIEDFEKKNN